MEFQVSKTQKTSNEEKIISRYLYIYEFLEVKLSLTLQATQTIFLLEMV